MTSCMSIKTSVINQRFKIIEIIYENDVLIIAVRLVRSGSACVWVIANDISHRRIYAPLALF